MLSKLFNIKGFFMKRKYKEYVEQLENPKNINEYYSFFGNVIYISDGYLYNEDYFIILKNNNLYDLIFINDKERRMIEDIDNSEDRLKLFDNIDKMLQEPSIIGYNGLKIYISNLLDSNVFSTVNNTNLLQIRKDSPFNLVQNMIVSCIEANRVDISLPKQYNTHFGTNEIRPNLIEIRSNFYNVYKTGLNINFEYIFGNAFMDFEFLYYSFKFKTRLYIYNLNHFDWFLDQLQAIEINNFEQSKEDILFLIEEFKNL